jgi:hypothetical protein
MAHEYSKTFKVGKDWVNAPSMHKGKSLSEDELMEKVSKGNLNKFKAKYNISKDTDISVSYNPKEKGFMFRLNSKF